MGRMTRWGLAAGKWIRARRAGGTAAAAAAADTTGPKMPGVPQDVAISDRSVHVAVSEAIEQMRFEEPLFGERLREAAAALEAWVDQLPASQAHHDAGAGGLIRHSARTLALAAGAIGAGVTTMEADPYLAAKFGDRMRLGMALAALYHDAGKIYDVEVGNQDARWDPVSRPLRDFCREIGGRVQIAWRADRGNAQDPIHHGRLQAAAMMRILPPAVWSALAPIGWWLMRTVMVGDESMAENTMEQSFARVLLRIRSDADRAAAAAGMPPTAAAGEVVVEMQADGAARSVIPPRPAAAVVRSTPARAPTATGKHYLVVPKHKGILKVAELETAIRTHGANELSSPILLGGLWVAVDAASSVYEEMFVPKMGELLSGELVAVCKAAHDDEAAAPKGNGEKRCTRGPEFPSALAIEPVAEAPKTIRELRFIHALAFDRAIPPEWMAFPGRIEFKEHGPRLNDFRKVLTGNSRNLIEELGAAMAGGRLQPEIDWFVLTDTTNERVQYVGLKYDTGVAPLAGETRENEPPRAYSGRLHGLWDRIVRMRRHVTPAVWRIAHTVHELRQLQLFVFDQVTSEEMLRHVGRGTR